MENARLLMKLMFKIIIMNNFTQIQKILVIRILLFSFISSGMFCKTPSSTNIGNVTTAVETNSKIRINQVGFYPLATKVAVVTGSIKGGDFKVLTENGDVAFSGKLSAEKKSAYSTTVTRIADFTELKKPGKYVVLVEGLGKSYPFIIDEQVFDGVAKSSIKGFYYQRTDIPLEEKFAGKWHRPAGHMDTAVLIHPSAEGPGRPAGTIVSSPGGWYDAGDYNKYIVNSGITMGTMLSAYEDFPSYYQVLGLNIPESGDQVPDLLDEVIYNLRWMLTMQDPADGGVYHKCTNAAFDGMVMPGVTKAPRYLVQKGTAATLDLAATAAQAARILKGFERQLPGLSDSCMAAAGKAWQWALKNPAVIYDQALINKTYQPAISTGEYGDRRFNDEWLWAASELFVTTGDRNYYNVVEQRLKDPVNLPSWGNVGMLGYYTLLRFQKTLPAYTATAVRSMKDSVLSIATQYILNAKENAFATVMGQSRRDFNWGSNSVAANQGILLVNAFLYTGSRAYLEGALSNLDYLLGRNATGYCFLTGTGTFSTMFPHHRPSEADGIPEPVPGLLAGGPNPGMQDKCVYEFTEPETAYTDRVCSYASNEIAINWNAPLVYLSGALEALRKKF
jgi:endoglucanase